MDQNLKKALTVSKDVVELAGAIQKEKPGEGAKAVISIVQDIFGGSSPETDPYAQALEDINEKLTVIIDQLKAMNARQDWQTLNLPLFNIKENFQRYLAILQTVKLDDATGSIMLSDVRPFDINAFINGDWDKENHTKVLDHIYNLFAPASGSITNPNFHILVSNPDFAQPNQSAAQLYGEIWENSTTMNNITKFDAIQNFVNSLLQLMRTAGTIYEAIRQLYLSQPPAMQSAGLPPVPFFTLLEQYCQPKSNSTTNTLTTDWSNAVQALIDCTRQPLDRNPIKNNINYWSSGNIPTPGQSNNAISGMVNFCTISFRQSSNLRNPNAFLSGLKLNRVSGNNFCLQGYYSVLNEGGAFQGLGWYPSDIELQGFKQSDFKKVYGAALPDIDTSNLFTLNDNQILVTTGFASVVGGDVAEISLEYGVLTISDTGAGTIDKTKYFNTQNGDNNVPFAIKQGTQLGGVKDVSLIKNYDFSPAARFVNSANPLTINDLDPSGIVTNASLDFIGTTLKLRVALAPALYNIKQMQPDWPKPTVGYFLMLNTKSNLALTSNGYGQATTVANKRNSQNNQIWIIRKPIVTDNDQDYMPDMLPDETCLVITSQKQDEFLGAGDPSAIFCKNTSFEIPGLDPPSTTECAPQLWWRLNRLPNGCYNIISMFDLSGNDHVEPHYLSSIDGKTIGFSKEDDNSGAQQWILMLAS
jgi:hypothetical protein